MTQVLVRFVVVGVVVGMMPAVGVKFTVGVRVGVCNLLLLDGPVLLRLEVCRFLFS